jgi:hypothetical protein
MFRYENMWTRDPSYNDLVKSSWRCGTKSVESSLLNMQRSLRQWSCDVFGYVRGKLKKLRKELEEVCKKSWHGGISREENDLLKKISELLAREEIMMRQ